MLYFCWTAPLQIRFKFYLILWQFHACHIDHAHSMSTPILPHPLIFARNIPNMSLSTFMLPAFVTHWVSSSCCLIECLLVLSWYSVGLVRVTTAAKEALCRCPQLPVIHKSCLVQTFLLCCPWNCVLPNVTIRVGNRDCGRVGSRCLPRVLSFFPGKTSEPTS